MIIFVIEPALFAGRCSHIFRSVYIRLIKSPAAHPGIRVGGVPFYTFLDNKKATPLGVAF
jgi:hypothetical protein